MKIFMLNCLIGLVAVLLTPVLMIGGVVRFWQDFMSGTYKLKEFLAFGRLGAESEITICTNVNNILWIGRSWEVPKAIHRMRVYSYFAHEGKLFIKVYRNDKLIEQFNRAKADELPDRE